MGLDVGEGAVVCMAPMILPIDGKNRYIPVDASECFLF